MQSTVRLAFTSFAVAILASGCATSFTGEAHIEGPGACREKCSKWGMDLSGMVAMGEYSDACICRVRGKGGGTDETGAVGSAAVGVVMQMRAAEERQHMMMR